MSLSSPSLPPSLPSQPSAPLSSRPPPPSLLPPATTGLSRPPPSPPPPSDHHRTTPPLASPSPLRPLRRWILPPLACARAVESRRPLAAGPCPHADDGHGPHSCRPAGHWRPHRRRCGRPCRGCDCPRQRWRRCAPGHTPHRPHDQHRCAHAPGFGASASSPTTVDLLPSSDATGLLPAAGVLSHHIDHNDLTGDGPLSSPALNPSQAFSPLHSLRSTLIAPRQASPPALTPRGPSGVGEASHTRRQGCAWRRQGRWGRAWRK
jgi:hypothetical protein